MQLPVVDKLKKEIEKLQYELNHRLPKQLEEARAHGDLSENAEWDAAKERQEFVKARILQLQTRLRELSMYTLSSIPNEGVGYGSRVTVEDSESGESAVYELVFPEEADANDGRISMSSPLGRALMNKGAGDEVEVDTPKGKLFYEIVEVVTLHEITEKTKD